MADAFLQRAELLADLGHYDEAAQELAQAHPGDARAATLLARVRLAAASPRPALAAAQAAAEAAPVDPAAMVARGLALAELGRVDEAAHQAEAILQLPEPDGYALASAAVILAAVRNGQVALDAAWEAVRRDPAQPRSHLVLGLVAGRLGLMEIAARAYQEALALDPRLPEPDHGVGLARLEQHRYAVALARLLGQRLRP